MSKPSRFGDNDDTNTFIERLVKSSPSQKNNVSSANVNNDVEMRLTSDPWTNDVYSRLDGGGRTNSGSNCKSYCVFIYSIITVLIGIFLFIVGIIEKQKHLMPLCVKCDGFIRILFVMGGITIFVGLLGIVAAKTRSKIFAIPFMILIFLISVTFFLSGIIIVVFQSNLANKELQDVWRQTVKGNPSIVCDLQAEFKCSGFTAGCCNFNSSGLTSSHFILTQFFDKIHATNATNITNLTTTKSPKTTTNVSKSTTTNIPSTTTTTSMPSTTTTTSMPKTTTTANVPNTTTTTNIPNTTATTIIPSTTTTANVPNTTTTNIPNTTTTTIIPSTTTTATIPNKTTTTIMPNTTTVTNLTKTTHKVTSTTVSPNTTTHFTSTASNTTITSTTPLNTTTRIPVVIQGICYNITDGMPPSWVLSDCPNECAYNIYNHTCDKDIKAYLKQKLAILLGVIFPLAFLTLIVSILSFRMTKKKEYYYY